MNNLMDTIKGYYLKVKTAHINIKSLQFVKFVITTSFIPIFMYLGAWLYAIYAMHVGFNVTILISLLTELRLFVAVIFSTQTVAGVLAYGVALIDSDGDGESDELDTKAHKQSQDISMFSNNGGNDIK